MGRRRPPPAPAIVVSVAHDSDPEDNESALLVPLESSLAEAMHFASIEGRATRSGAALLMTLDADVDPFAATQQAQQIIAAKMNLLPRDAMLPVVMRGGAPDGFRFHLTGAFTLTALREALDDHVGLALAQLPGVGKVSSWRRGATRPSRHRHRRGSP